MEQKGYAMYTASFGEFNYKNHTNISHLRRAINPIQDVLALVQLVRLIKRLKPHIVHTHTPKAGLLGMFVVWICMIPEKIEMQVCFLVENPKYDLVSTGLVSVTDDLVYVGHRGKAESFITCKDLVFKRKSVVHAAIMARKEWFLRNKYNENLKRTQDLDLWIKSAIKDDFNIKVFDDLLYYYREENSATVSNVLKGYKNERTIYRLYLPFFIASYVNTVSFAKTIIVYLLKLIHRTDLLLVGRSETKNKNEIINKLNKDIAVIRNCNVEGLKSI
jgi:hypothetical protein